MKKLNYLIDKDKRIDRWNLLGLFLFFFGLLSFGLTSILTVKLNYPFFVFSIIPTIPIFIISGIYTHNINKIIDEILTIFKHRLKWGINNSYIYATTTSSIKKSHVGKYTIIVECPQKYETDISSMVEEIINDFNKQLPHKFKLLPRILTKR